jgi:addiction module RelE/StbE family toxin
LAVNRVVWARQAILDVEAIRDYISRDSQHYATVVVDQILTAVDRLEKFPRSGRRVPERPGSELRELLCANYRIVYRVSGELVEVMTVFHGARIAKIPWEVREVRRAS